MEMELSGEEREVLLRVLKGALAETRVEVRRAVVPRFRRDAKREEATLRALISRLEPADLGRAEAQGVQH